jgi:hypothetical protein
VCQGERDQWNELINFDLYLTITEMEMTIAIISLVLSIITLWLTYLHRGTIKMTQPTTIFFGPDDQKSSKVYLRTLLFSTSQTGQVIESMHVKLYRGESVQTFNIWVHGERVEIVRGSGLYVGKEGVAHNHHFLLPKDGSVYEFLAGKYKLEVYASILNRTPPKKVFSIELEISDTNAAKLKDGRSGVYFDWGPESNKYHPYLHEPKLTGEEFSRLLR